MTRFDTYRHLRDKAEDETKIGGDPLKAIAFAILALAEATIATEADSGN